MLGRRLVHGLLIVAIVVGHCFGSSAERQKSPSQVDAYASLALRSTAPHFVHATRGKEGDTCALAFGHTANGRWLQPPVAAVCNTVAQPRQLLIVALRQLLLVPRPPPFA